MARPTKPERDRRGKLFQIRLLADERTAIDHAARAAGLNSSAWARMVLLEKTKESVEKH